LAFSAISLVCQGLVSGKPQGSEARAVIGASSAIGRRLEAAIGYSGQMEQTFLPRKTRKLDPEVI